MNKIKKAIIFASTSLLLAAPAYAADPAVGIWKTEPDRKNYVSLIKIRQCGPKLCGRIVKAFAPSGKEVKTKHVGKELFWGIESKGNGDYDNGTVYVPMLNIKANAGMKLRGRKLHVKGCKASLCNGQTWTKL